MTMRNEYRDAIRKTKQESWINFWTDIEKGAEAAKLGKFRSRNPNDILRIYFPSLKRSEKKMMTHLRQPKPSVAQLGAKWRLVCEIVTTARVRRVLKSFSPYKSPRLEDPVF